MRMAKVDMLGRGEGSPKAQGKEGQGQIAHGILLRAGFREGDEDSNFSVFRVRRFTEWPGPLHWIAFPVEILTKPLIHWIASPLFTENSFFSLNSASLHPLQPQIGSEQCFVVCVSFSRGGVGMGSSTLRKTTRKQHLLSESLVAFCHSLVGIPAPKKNI